MSQLPKPQLDHHPFIELLFDGMEASVRSKAFASFCDGTPFLNHHEGFRDENMRLEALANETLSIFNEISRKIGGIPVRVLHEDTEQVARVLGVSAWVQGSWIFMCQSDTDSTPFQTSYSDIGQLRSAYYAAQDPF